MRTYMVTIIVYRYPLLHFLGTLRDSSSYFTQEKANSTRRCCQCCFLSMPVGGIVTILDCGEEAQTNN